MGIFPTLRHSSRFVGAAKSQGLRWNRRSPRDHHVVVAGPLTRRSKANFSASYAHQLRLFLNVLGPFGSNSVSTTPARPVPREQWQGAENAPLIPCVIHYECVSHLAGRRMLTDVYVSPRCVRGASITVPH